MIVDYRLTEVYTKQLEVEDPGNTCIRCTTSTLFEYYILTKTVLGKTSFITFGPMMPDMPDMLLNDFSFTHSKFDYNLAKVTKLITGFINNSKKDIEDSEIISEEDALDSMPDLLDAYKNIELEEGNY